jgi:membrane-bound lytic murein transglycosylase D
MGAAVLLASCGSTEQKRAIAAPPMRAQAPTITADKVTSKPEIPEVKETIIPKVDPVEALIAKVEREYQAGQANYNAGHLEAAKQNFDNAFNILLEGPPAVASDDRLQQEFDKIVEGTHNLELIALKEGDGFTEQPSEPAPIDEANEVTFPVDPNIRAKAEQELKTTQSDLPLTLNDAVASYISYFSNRGRHFLEHGYVRSGRYHEMISRILKQEGVPQDLIYLAQAESGFHPLALSRAGARGMWQFMASRGADYGLRRNWWVDDRQDPELATRAAAKHLKDLYNQFGDWYLAMAAYNSGPGTVQRAVERTGYADYWELYKRGVLPAETRNYVPIILAITIMSKNPAQYGLDRLRSEQPIEYDTVTVKYPVDLRLVAECTDTSLSTLQELNPSLIRMTTPKDQPFALHLPMGTKAKYEEAIAAIPVDKRVWWHYHRVAPGETLAGIAHKYHTTAEAIAEANNLAGEELGARTNLVIPVAPPKHSERMAFSKKATRYKVRRGDTVASVAADFGVPAENVRRWNRLKGNSLKSGRVLIIHRAIVTRDAEPRESASTGSRARLAEVSDAEADDAPAPCVKWATHGKGKHARRVCVARAKKPVRAQSQRAKVEQVTDSEGGSFPAPCVKWSTKGKGKHAKRVCVEREKKATREAAEKSGKSAKRAETRKKPEVIHHRVKRGETLSSIATDYNTTVSALKRDNHNVAHLKAGTVLIIRQE